MDEPQTNSNLLYGVPAIAEFLNLREKQCRHRIDQKIIPSFRVGGTICATRSSLASWIQDQERKAIKAARAAGLPPAPEAEQEGSTDGE